MRFNYEHAQNTRNLKFNKAYFATQYSNPYTGIRNSEKAKIQKRENKQKMQCLQHAKENNLIDSNNIAGLVDSFPFSPQI